jgi:hypothetical protein
MIYVSSTGNDSNAGTLEAPVLTLQKAYDLATDTIFVLNTVSVTATLTMSKVVNFTGYGVATSVLNFGTLSTTGIIVNVDGVTFANILISAPYSASVVTIANQNDIIFNECEIEYFNAGITFGGNNLFIKGTFFEGKYFNAERSMVKLTRLNGGCVYMYNCASDVESSTPVIHVIWITGTDTKYGSIIINSNDLVCPHLYDVIYTDNFATDDSMGLNVNIVNNEFACGSCINNSITGLANLGLYHLVNVRNNVFYGTYTLGMFYTAGTGITGTLSNIIGKFMFESNTYTTNYVGAMLYNNNTLITAMAELVFPANIDVTEPTDLKYNPYLTDPNTIALYIKILDANTKFDTAGISLLVFKDSVVISVANLIMTLTTPVTGHYYLANAELTLTRINTIMPEFLFAFYEYDGTVSPVTVSETLSFYFIPTTPFKENTYHLFLMDQSGAYNDTWNTLTQTSTYIYTVLITSAGQYSTMNPMIFQHSFNNIYANALSCTGTSVGGTLSMGGLSSVNNGTTELYTTHFNDNVGIKMDISTIYALAVSGSAYLSTSSLWSTGSDIRVKTAIKDVSIEGIIEFVKALDVVEFEYDKYYQDDKGKIRIGLIAQQIEKLEKKYIPEMSSMIRHSGNVWVGKKLIVDMLAIDISQLLFYITLCICAIGNTF